MGVEAPAGELTRERVLRLADALFARHGYAAVSMREVATAAGVTKPALYYHFRDKEALFEECLHLSQARLGDMLREAARSGGRGLDERVEALVRVLLADSPHHPVRTQADVAEHLPVEARRRLARGFADNVMRPVREVFQAAQEAGELRAEVEPETAAGCLMAVAMACAPGTADDDGDAWGCLGAPSGGTSRERLAAVVSDVTLRGIATSA